MASLEGPFVDENDEGLLQVQLRQEFQRTMALKWLQVDWKEDEEEEDEKLEDEEGRGKAEIAGNEEAK